MFFSFHIYMDYRHKLNVHLANRLCVQLGVESARVTQYLLTDECACFPWRVGVSHSKDGRRCLVPMPHLELATRCSPCTPCAVHSWSAVFSTVKIEVTYLLPRLFDISPRSSWQELGHQAAPKPYTCRLLDGVDHGAHEIWSPNFGD